MIDGGWTEALPGRYGDTAVWRVDLEPTPAQREACLARLSEDEARRAQRFLRGADRDRFVVSHAALRMILAAELGVDPAALAFVADGSGKPHLGGRFRGSVAFNLSHSGAVGLVAVSPEARIGVDVEAVRTVDDGLRIATAHFAASEAHALSRLSGHALTEAFFACWTCKEAFVKAVGVGITAGLDRFAVSIPPAPTALLQIDGDTDAARAWSLVALWPDASHMAAVAIERPHVTCALRSLRPGWAD